MQFNQLIPELAVTNVEKSLKFYTKILPFKIKYQRKEEGFAFIELNKAQLMLDQINKGRTWTADVRSIQWHNNALETLTIVDPSQTREVGASSQTACIK